MSVFKCLFKKMNHFGHQKIINACKNHRNFHLFKKRGGNGVFNADVAVSFEMPEEDLKLGYSGVLIHHYKKSLH